MSGRRLISLDAMGGDKAPGVVVDGAALALERHPDLRFLIFGDEARVAPLLATRPKLSAAVELRHTADWIASDAKPARIRARGMFRQVLAGAQVSPEP